MRHNAGSVIVAVVDTDMTHVESLAGSRAWARAFAAMYDPFLWVGEQAGLRKHRKELLERSAGYTIEIGAGTGLNLAHYPDDLDGLALVEPDAGMRRRLAERLVDQPEVRGIRDDVKEGLLSGTSSLLLTVVASVVIRRVLSGRS